MKESPEKRLVSTGTNSAGYPVYERRVSAPTEEKIDVADEPDMGRRGFLKFLGTGAVAAAAATAMPVFLKQKEDPVTHEYTPLTTSDKVGELVEQSIEEEVEEQFESFSDSSHFNHAVEAYMDGYERDIPFVLEYGRKVTVGDTQKRSRIEYVASMLECKNVPESIMRELRTYVVGLCFEESRYDASRVSGGGAKGVLQIIPATWNDLAHPDANEYSLVDQTIVAGKLLSQTYQHLVDTNTHELQAIEAEFFDGDREAFDVYFMTPLLLNAYNAGMGTMSQLVHWFAHTFGTQESVIGVFGQEEILSGYDVFHLLAQKGKELNVVSWYQDDASSYVLKVYAATRTLQEHTQDEIRA